MEAGLDKHWLSGEPAWWPRSEMGISHSQFSHELDPSEEWVGWRRQRFQPMAARFVRAPAWSLALLVATLFPLLFPGNTPDDQTVASILFLASFVLLLVQPIRIASEMPDGDGLRMLTWLLFKGGGGRTAILLTLTGTVAFIGHIIIDVRIGWLSYALFLTLWYHLTCRAGNALIHPAGRWLAPIADEWSGAILAKGWSVESERFRVGPLASKILDEGARLEVYGVVRGRDRFLAFQLRHPSSLLHDPFVNGGGLNTMGFSFLGSCSSSLKVVGDYLKHPPTISELGEWPTRYNGGGEEE